MPQGERKVNNAPPVEFIDLKGNVIGMNGARFNQLLAQEYPLNRVIKARLKVLGLSSATPPQRQMVEY